MDRVISSGADKSVSGWMGRWVCGLAVSVFALAVAPSAWSQSALGNGNGLQRNLHRFNQSLPGRDPLASSRYQNSVVNGNAPGGKSFQGNLGYRNPSDFQGRLGSNDLFNFSRDSAFSGLAGQGIRGSQLNDYQGALARGERGLSASLGGVFDVQRQGTNYNKLNQITSSARNPGGRRDTFGAASIGNSRLSATDSFGSGSDSGDSLQSSLRSSLEASLSPGLGRPRGASGGRGSPLSRGGGSLYGADSLMGDSLGSRSGTSDRSITGNDRVLGLSGATSDAMRDRSRGAAPLARPGQVPTNKVGGSTGAGLGPDLAVPKLKTSFDDLQDRLGKLDATPTLKGIVPLDDLPDPRPESATPDAAAPGDGPGATPSDRAGAPKTNPDGTPPLGPKVPVTWQSRMEDLRGQLAGEPGKKGKVTLLGSAKRTSGFVDRRLVKPGAKAGEDGGIGSTTGSRPGEGVSGGSDPVTLPSRSGITPENATGLPVRGRDEAVKPGDAGTPRARIDPKTLQLIRDAGGKVETLRPSGATGKDYFAEHMQAGEKLLGESMFFDAEERFNKAVAVKPGDVTGHVGRVHAQMGSGLFLSAGSTLRKVLAAYPEATGQRYGGALLPTKQRLEQVAIRLRENVSGVAEPEAASDGPIRRDSALLLAYLGFQTGERKTVEEGITAMTAAIGQDPEAKPGEDERLIELLRGVWLDDSFYGAAENAPAGTKSPEK